MSGAAAARGPETGSSGSAEMSSTSFGVANSYRYTTRSILGGGLPRQSLYMLIDFVMVLACSTVVFSFRFDNFFLTLLTAASFSYIQRWLCCFASAKTFIERHGKCLRLRKVF